MSTTVTKFWELDHFGYIVPYLPSKEKRILLQKTNQLEGSTISRFDTESRQDCATRRQDREQNHDNLTFLPRILMKFSNPHATMEKGRVVAFLGIRSASADDTLQLDYSRSDLEVLKLWPAIHCKLSCPSYTYRLPGC